jgi:hypothetical protein
MPLGQRLPRVVKGAPIRGVSLTKGLREKSLRGRREKTTAELPRRWHGDSTSHASASDPTVNECDLDGCNVDDDDELFQSTPLPDN